MPFYAVRVGRKPGVYLSWAECHTHVTGFPKAKYAKFSTREEALSFVKDRNVKVKNDVAIKQEDIVPKKSKSCSVEKGPRTSSRKAVSKVPVEAAESNGACPSNGRGAITAGYGIHFPSRPELDSFGGLQKPPFTNQRAELVAILKCLELLQEKGEEIKEEVEINTDSMYAINCLTKWYVAWERESWEVPKHNLDLIRAIISLARQRPSPIYLRHVRGHSGIPGNDRADQLAVKGATPLQYQKNNNLNSNIPL